MRIIATECADKRGEFLYFKYKIKKFAFFFEEKCAKDLQDKKKVVPLQRIRKEWDLNAEIAQLVEHDLAKVGVASSSLVFRSILKRYAQVAEW